MNRLSGIIKSKLFSNMSWLFVVNAANSLIPYLILPYITQRFGPALYGRFSFSITFVGYFSTLIEFGFDLTSARAIATSKTDDEINTIFSTTFVCRIILFLACIPFILISIFSFKKVNECSTELLIMIILLFSNTIMTTWFYHGKQIMKHISIISVVIRSTYTILVFLLVKSQNEYFLYVVIYVIAALLISSIALQIAHQRFNLSFRKVSFRQICDRYKEAFFVFISNCTISFASTAGVLISGFLYTFENVGYYSIMEKISTLITMTYIPIGQALYPETSRRFVNSFASGVAYVKKIAKYIIPFYTFGCAALMVFRKPVIRFVFGEQYLVGEDLLLLLLFIPVLSICSNLIGTQVLLASGRNKDYGKAFAIGSVFSVLFYVVSVYFFHSRGIVIAMIAWEVLTILLMLLFSKRALSAKKESKETIIVDSTNNTAKQKSIMMILYHDINVDGRSMELLQCAVELGNVTFVSYIVPESKNLDITTYKVCGGKRKYIRFVIETARRLLKEKPEIVFLQNMYGAILIKIAKLANKKAKVIYDSSELYITGVKSRGAIKQRISFLIKKMEEKYIFLADVVLAPTKERAYILKGYYSLPHMPLIFDNMHKLTDEVNADKCKKIYGSLLENKFVIVYGGGIAESRYTYEICDAVHSLSDEFILIITGAAGEDDLRRFNKWKEDTKNSNVVYLGMLKKDEWRFLLQNARISISAYKFTELNLIFCASGKVYEGLFEGVPLLATLNPPFYTLCHDYGVGVSTDNFAEGIQTICHNYDLFLSNVKEYISTLDYNKRIPILAARIRQQIE